MPDPLKILIAEDDRMTRRILQATFAEHPGLARHPMELTLAVDGAQAMTHLRQTRFDLVIADLFMPRIDGFALCREIRDHEHGLDVPIVVMSAVWKQPELLDKLKKSFGAVFLEKPFEADDLVALVTSLLVLEP